MNKNFESLKEDSELDNIEKIEAILFISGKFVNLRELISISDLNPIVIREAIKEFVPDRIDDVLHGSSGVIWDGTPEEIFINNAAEVATK